MRKIFNKIVSVVANISLLVGTLIPLARPVPAYASTAWSVGDVFVGVSSGSYKVYDNAGVFKETISDGLGGGAFDFTTGCAFNNTLDKLYTTYFSQTKVKVYDDAIPHTLSSTIDTGVVSPGGHSESIVFAANGDFYVGHPDGNDDIQKYSSAGVYLASYDVPIESRGSDWMDLDSFQTTMYYTSEGRKVMKYDVSGAGAPLPDFAVLPGAGIAFALRLLPPGDGSGGLLVADNLEVKKLDGTGAVVATYDVTGEGTWFSLNLDPDGTSFWAGNYGTGKFYKFDIATPGVDTHLLAVDTGVGSSKLFGICLKGEPTAAGEEDTRRMTGGGSVFTKNPGRVTHGFELHCDATKLPNRLEVNWDKGNKFHLENLTSAVCVDDPLLDEEQPVAGFDTYKGKGTGRYNGVSGYKAEWVFTDDGEPGKNDTLKLVIIDPVTLLPVLTVGGKLDVGNHQAHAQ